jgi:hypothetical protein
MLKHDKTLIKHQPGELLFTEIAGCHTGDFFCYTGCRAGSSLARFASFRIMTPLRDVAFIGLPMRGKPVHQPFLLLVPLCLILVEKMALRKMLCAVLLCRLSVGHSSPLKDTMVSDQLTVICFQCTQSPPWEGEAPAEPNETVRVQLSLLADNHSPIIPDAEDKNCRLGFSLSLPTKWGVHDGFPPLYPREFRLFGLQIETALIRQW